MCWWFWRTYVVHPRLNSVLISCFVSFWFFSASAVFGPFQQNQVHTPSTDCTDHIYKERGNSNTVFPWDCKVFITSESLVCQVGNFPQFFSLQTSSVGEAHKLVAQAADLLSAIHSSIQHGIQSQNDTTKGGRRRQLTKRRLNYLFFFSSGRQSWWIVNRLITVRIGRIFLEVHVGLSVPLGLCVSCVATSSPWRRSTNQA